MATKTKIKRVKVPGYHVPAHDVPGHTRHVKVNVKTKHKKK